MRSLTVGVFHDEPLLAKLGKKGTMSDIAMYHRKAEDCIFTFMSPVEDKLTAKSQIISTIDAAVIVFSQMTRELGETILMLDMCGVKEGIAVTTNYATATQISAIIQKTSLKTYRIEEEDQIKLMALLSGIDPQRNPTSSAIIVVDHSFSVKGVGEVALGFVKTGTVKKYDKLRLLPAGKEVMVRSIQVQDDDKESAEAGTRVGLALKGASVDELERGAILTDSEGIQVLPKTKISFEKSLFYTDDFKEGTFHATVGMQTVPVTVSDPRSDSVVIESAKPIVYAPGDTLLLLDLNAKKTRVVGKSVL